jgi:hypothetical protein
MNKVEFAKVFSLFVFVVVLILFLMGLLGISGCKAVEKYKKSSQFPADCAEKFPIKTDSIYVEGQEVRDTIYRIYEYELEPQHFTDTAIVTRTIYKTITVRKTDTIVSIRENTAAIEACKREYEKVTGNLMKEMAAQDATIGQEREGRKRNAKQRNWLLVIIAAFLIGNYRHSIIKLFSR